MENMVRLSMAAAPTAQGIFHEDGRSSHAEQISQHAPIQLEPNAATDNPDHFVERDGMRFAGTHLIIDLWEAASLDDLDAVKTALQDAAKAAGATVLKIDLHRFTPNGGITGVALLAESRISIHTWPECAYAAVDLFMCGDAEPHKGIEVLRRAFRARMLAVSEHRRGVMP